VTDDEVDLVRGCLSGSEVALQAFVERFQVPVFGLCVRMLGHREDAEDVAQEVFLRAFRNLHRWDQERPLRPWLLAIAANRCRTRLSQRVREAVNLDHLEPALPADRNASRSELAEELQLALEKLREEYRLCFILFHQNELGLSEIARIVGSPEGTIKTWLFRARRELADHLRRRGFVQAADHELHRI
jgi:RNA polymerase sigma-70 factor, ECF subfamily